LGWRKLRKERVRERDGRRKPAINTKREGLSFCKGGIGKPRVCVKSNGEHAAIRLSRMVARKGRKDGGVFIFIPGRKVDVILEGERGTIPKSNFGPGRLIRTSGEEDVRGLGSANGREKR